MKQQNLAAINKGHLWMDIFKKPSEFLTTFAILNVKCQHSLKDILHIMPNLL